MKTPIASDLIVAKTEGQDAQNAHHAYQAYRADKIGQQEQAEDSQARQDDHAQKRQQPSQPAARHCAYTGILPCQQQIPLHCQTQKGQRRGYIPCQRHYHEAPQQAQGLERGLARHGLVQPRHEKVEETARRRAHQEQRQDADWRQEDRRRQQQLHKMGAIEPKGAVEHVAQTERTRNGQPLAHRLLLFMAQGCPGWRDRTLFILLNYLLPPSPPAADPDRLAPQARR